MFWAFVKSKRGQVKFGTAKYKVYSRKEDNSRT